MGLIVSLAYLPETRTADLQITYTAMGCPAMDFIEDDIREALLADPDVDAVDLEVVWDRCGRRAASARSRARPCGGWGSSRDRRRRRLGGLRPPGPMRSRCITSARSPSPTRISRWSPRERCTTSSRGSR
jgi:metal-sulfur cluster biosynthetic enzyme